MGLSTPEKAALGSLGTLGAGVTMCHHLGAQRPLLSPTVDRPWTSRPGPALWEPTLGHQEKLPGEGALQGGWYSTWAGSRDWDH